MPRRPQQTRLNFTQLEAREMPVVALIADVLPFSPPENQAAADAPRVTDATGRSYFIADDRVHGRELWTSDGLPDGTYMVADLSPGPASTDIKKIVLAGGKVVFAADPAGGAIGPELFVSDGTAAGTVRLLDSTVPAPSDPTVFLSTVTGLAAAGDDVVYGLYAPALSGGLRTAPERTAVATPGQSVNLEYGAVGEVDDADHFVGLSGGVVFTARSSTLGRGLFATFTPRGAAEPTTVRHLADTLFNPVDTVVKVTDDLAAVLLPKDGGAFELWVTDGPTVNQIRLPAGTTLLGGLVAAGGKAYVSARGADGTDELWVTDGSLTGTARLATGLNPESPDAPLRLLRTDGIKLYFPASDGTHGMEMWVSDGTPAGTHLLRDLNPGAGGSVDQYLQTAGAIIPQPNGFAYFLATPGGSGSAALYRTDGTAAGTLPVENQATLANFAALPRFYVGTGRGSVLFESGGEVAQLWRADSGPAVGAAATTLQLSAVSLTPTGPLYPETPVTARLTATVSSPGALPAGTVRFSGNGQTFDRTVTNGQTEPLLVPLSEAQLRALFAAGPGGFTAEFFPSDPALFAGSTASAVQFVASPDLADVDAPAIFVPPAADPREQVVAGSNITLRTHVSSLLPLDLIHVRFDLTGPSYTGPLASVPVAADGTAEHSGSSGQLAPGGYAMWAVVETADGRFQLAGSSSHPFAVVDANAVARPTTTSVTADVDAGIFFDVFVKLTATVTSPGGVPTGWVDFRRGTFVTRVPLVDGVAETAKVTLTDDEVTQITHGDFSGFAATYVPDDPTEFRPSNASVGRANLPSSLLELKSPTVSPGQVAHGETVRLRADVYSFGLYQIPDSTLQVKFEAVGPTGVTELATLPVVKLLAEADVPVNLSDGTYTVRATLLAGGVVTLGEVDGGTLTVSGYANILRPQQYQSSGVTSADAAIGATPPQGDVRQIPGFLGALNAGFSMLNFDLSSVTSQITSAYLRAIAPMVGNDAIPDEVWVVGAGGPGLVVVRDGATGEAARAVLPFEASFEGGVLVTAGDLNGDGQFELVFTPDDGGSGRTVVYDPASGQRLADFFGIDDQNFRGGARSAIALLDGVVTVLIAAGTGGGPRLAGYSAASLFAGDPQRVFNDFFVFEQALRNGAYITSGDVTGDGVSDLIAGGGPGGGPRVLVLDGAALAAGAFTPVANFFAGNPDSRNGVRVFVERQDGDDRADLVTVDPVTNAKGVYLGSELTLSADPSRHDPLEFLGGVPVG